jgi:hypothetical protein
MVGAATVGRGPPPISANRRTRRGRYPGRTCAGTPGPTQNRRCASAYGALDTTRTTPEPASIREGPRVASPVTQVPAGTDSVQILHDTARHSMAFTTTNRHVSASRRTSAPVDAVRELPQRGPPRKPSRPGTGPTSCLDPRGRVLTNPIEPSRSAPQRARAGVGDFAQLRRLESILLAYPQSAHTSARSGNGRARIARPPGRSCTIGEVPMTASSRTQGVPVSTPDRASSSLDEPRGPAAYTTAVSPQMSSR